MKVCLITSLGALPGGVGNWEKIIEKEIRKDKDVELTIIDIEASKRSSEKTIFDSIFNGGYVMLRTYIKLCLQIAHNRPDVVHMTTSGGLGFFRDLLLLRLLRKRNIPSVYHIHFGRTVQYKEKNSRCYRQIRKAVSMATGTIVIDRPTYEILEKYANEITEINNPIDVESMSVYRQADEDNVFVYLGTVIRTKGVEELIEGFNRFNDEYEDEYRLHIVGPGTKKYISQLKSKACKNITFIGEVNHEKAMHILASAKAIILPSYTEGFPNVILEAMALQKCVIATNVGAIPEILAEDSGIIIKPQNTEQIKEALIQAANSVTRNRLAKKGYERVREFYDADSTYIKYKSLWKKCITE